MDETTQYKTTARRLTRWVAVLILAGSTLSAYGQATPGEEFNALLNAGCNDPNAPPPSLALCNEYRADGGQPDQGVDVGGQNNFGTLGALNQTVADVGDYRPVFRGQTWRVFGSVNTGSRQRSTTRLENGYDGDVIGAAFGVDKSLSDQLVAGLILGQFQFDADFDLAAGRIETDTRSAALFLSYNHSETATASFYLGRDSLDLDVVRNINVGTGSKQASSSTTGSQNVAGINVFFEWAHEDWVVGTDLSIDYIDAKIDAFEETSTMGSTNYLLRYPSQDIESLTLSTGVEIAYNASTSWGVVVPRLRIAYLRETENEAREVQSSLAVIAEEETQFSFTTRTDPADKNFFAASIGASAVLAGDWQLFVDATSFAGNSLLTNWVINLGVNKHF